MTNSLFELLPESALVTYHCSFPHVKVELSLNPSASLKVHLQKSLLDTACLSTDPLPASEWRVWDAVEVPIVLVANSKHPFARKSSVAPDELMGQELILMEASAPYSLQFQQFLSQHYLDCQPFLRMQSTEAARRLVDREPAFLSVLPLYTVLASVRAQRLCIVPLADWQHVQSVQLVLYRSKAMTPQIKGFLEELHLVLAENLSQGLNP